MYIKILDSKLYSPSLKDAAWLEDAHLIFLTFVCKFGWMEAIHGKKLQTNVMQKLLCEMQVDFICASKNTSTNAPSDRITRNHSSAHAL